MKIISRQELIYIGLGIFLGTIGAHNFYWRQKKRAYTHLGLVFISPLVILIIAFLFPAALFDSGYNVFDVIKVGLLMGFPLGCYLSHLMAGCEVICTLSRIGWRSLYTS